MAETLTPQQKQAVQDRGGRLLVSAAAGSGKTKVLVDRLMRYLQDPIHPANIDEFLLITYTKAAASELRGKIAAKLTEKIAEDPQNKHLQRQMQRLYLTKISTVHAFCGDILREYAYQLNIPGDFRVADENECAALRLSVVESVLTDAYETAGEHPDFCAFVDSQGVGRSDAQVPELILKVYDSAKCHLDPQKWLDECLQKMDVGNVQDAADTPFGKYLMERLHSWLDLQMEAMAQAASLAEQAGDMEKVAVLMANTVHQLTALRKCTQWDQIVAKGDVDFGRLVFPKNIADAGLADSIKAVRANCKKGLEKQLRPFADPSQRVLQDLGSCLQAAKGLVALVQAFEKAFAQAKRTRRILDFSDLEHKMLDLLWGKSRSGITAVADEIGARFREIMVDEYQDSNEVQDAIYHALSCKKQDLFMVGDVKQSIYQFRLADPGIFLKKYAAFVPAEEAVPGEDRKVVLSRNFRSGGAVLAAANDVFRTCMCPEVGGLYYGDEEALYEGVAHIPLDSPEIELFCVDVQQDTYEEEAAFVAGKIQEMLCSGATVRSGDSLRPVRPEDIVILMRSPNSCGHYFQKALERVGIRCGSGGVDLLQTQEIGALRCLLQAVHNPRLDIPLIGALASPIFGFTADDLAQIRESNKRCSFYESLQLHPGEKSQAFLRTLQQLRLSMREHSLTGLLEEIWFLTGMDDVYAAMEDGQMRRENLQAFFQLAADFEAGGNCDLGRFLDYLENMQDKGLLTTAEQASSGAVTIMSIHKSKGLEFPVVFLCCLGREFNTESQRAQILCHKDMGLGLAVADRANRLRYPSIAKRAIAAQIGAEGISEEMRVLYVAMTRPKDRLIMTYASNRLEKDLQEMVQRMQIGRNQLLIREAVCPGEWILLTALGRTEAGELFALGGNPMQAVPGEPAWNIRVVQAQQAKKADQDVGEKSSLPEVLLEKMARGLAFRYPHAMATTAPSKQTATQRKGREKDQEAAEHTHQASAPQRPWREAKFVRQQAQGKEYGNAIHAVMQYIEPSVCTGETAVRQEIHRLVQQGYITPEQGDMADAKRIYAFFASELGQKLCKGVPCVREFKFSILEDGVHYDPSLTGEQVLLQGVVDCAILEEDGIIVLDFKTDYVTEESLPQKVDHYRPQVEAYANAMERIFQKPVKQSLLYFFGCNQFVAL